MSPETCQKRYSFQNPSNKTISAKQTQIISSLKSRKSCQPNELSNLPNGTKQCNSAGIGGDKDTVTKFSGKTGRKKPRQSLERSTSISTNTRRAITKSPIRTDRPTGCANKRSISSHARPLGSNLIHLRPSLKSHSASHSANHNSRALQYAYPDLEIFEIQPAAEHAIFESFASSEHVI